MSLTPSLFRLKREFKVVGGFRELMAQAEIGDIIHLFDSDDEALQARWGSKYVHLRHMNSYVAVGAETQSKGQKHLWLYRYDGMLMADLGVHSVNGIMPVAAQGILTWKTHDEETDENSAILTADTLTLIRIDRSEHTIFIGERRNTESDSMGNIWIEQEKQFVRLHITENGVEQSDYFAYDPMFSRRVPYNPISQEMIDRFGIEGEDLTSTLVPPDYIISGDSLWIHHPDGNFLRVGPDGAVSIIQASLITKGVNCWYAQDEWLAVLGEDEQTLQMFKDGTVYATLRVAYDVGSLISIGPLGAVYGTNWHGQYSYFLVTSDGKNILLADYDEGYFCVMVPEGVIMPPRGEWMSGGCLSLMVYK